MPSTTTAPCAVRLRTLGGLALLEDERQAPLQRKRLALLVLLAAADACGRAVPRDRLLALLWPESDADSARHSLKQAVYALRSRLGEGAVRTDPDALRLDGAVVASDLADFRRALAAGDDAAAVAHYGGPFLDGAHLVGAEFAQWADAERAELARQCAQALGTLGDRARAAGDVAGAVDWYRRRVALDPLHVAHTRALIVALADAGDVAGAVRHARVHERLLREQLDLAPDPSIAALAERLRARAAGPPPASSAPEPPPPNPVPPGPPQPLVPPPESPTSSSPAATPTAAPAAAPAATPAATPAAAPAAPEASPPDLPSARALQDEHGPAPHPPAAWRRVDWRAVARRPLRNALVLAGAAVLVALLGTFGPSAGARPPARTESAARVAVLPFRTSGAPPSLTYLREGAADLVAAHLPGDVGPRAFTLPAMGNPARPGSAEGGGSSLDDALAAAREAGADQVIVGAVIGGPGRVILSATLLDAADGRTRALARVAGHVDSLPWVAERLVIGLLAQAAGEPDWRFTALADAAPPAARAYLAGRVAARANRRAEAAIAFRRALELDSTFALAGLGLASTGAFRAASPNAGERAGLARAWALRARLGVADQALFEGYAGDGFLAPRTATQELADWEAATQVAPFAAETWDELGDRLLRAGPLVGALAARERAGAAFARAVWLDPAYVPARAHLAELAVLAGDTAGVRRAAAARPRTGAPFGDATDYVGWREAVLLGDTAARRTLVARLPRLADAVLRCMVGYGQLDGAPAADIERAAAELRQRSITAVAWAANAALLRHLALNQGRRPPDHLPGPTSPAARESEAVQHILEALYWDGSRTDAWAAAGGLTGRLAAGAAAAETRCVLALWSLAEGAAEPARAALAASGAGGGAGRGLVTPDDAGVCHTVLAADLAVRTRRTDAAAAVARLDSLSRLGRQSARGAWVNLALARLLEARGDAAGALAALRRRSYDWELGPAYLSTSLREEARLATLVGDVRGAAAARRHHAALRGTSSPGTSLAGTLPAGGGGS